MSSKVVQQSFYESDEDWLEDLDHDALAEASKKLLIWVRDQCPATVVDHAGTASKIGEAIHESLVLEIGLAPSIEYANGIRQALEAVRRVFDNRDHEFPDSTAADMQQTWII